jgi:hypothetical protein
VEAAVDRRRRCEPGVVLPLPPASSSTLSAIGFLISGTYPLLVAPLAERKHSANMVGRDITVINPRYCRSRRRSPELIPLRGCRRLCSRLPSKSPPMKR